MLNIGIIAGGSISYCHRTGCHMDIKLKWYSKPQYMLMSHYKIVMIV